LTLPKKAVPPAEVLAVKLKRIHVMGHTPRLGLDVSTLCRDYPGASYSFIGPAPSSIITCGRCRILILRYGKLATEAVKKHRNRQQ
jgi:hypothetical protein